MPRARFSPKALADLFAIWQYLAEVDLSYADQTIARVHEASTLIAALPYIGRVRTELPRKPRSYIVDPYIVFYELSHRGVRVLRVLHGSRDIPTLLHGE